MAETRREDKGDVLTEEKVERPKRYKVLIHNDDYTTMEFVVLVLTTVFKHTSASATRLMLAIHRTGIGVAGVYAKEIAETKLEQALSFAREQGHPLQVTMEEE